MGNLLQLGTSLIAEAGEHENPTWIGMMVYTALVLAIIFGLMASAKKGINTRVFSNSPAKWAEQLYLFIENMCVGIIGSHGRKYIPMMLTFWLVIFISNVVALFFPTAPTAMLSFNLGMALISIGYVQYEGMRSNGVFGHWKHFSGPKLGGLLVVISGMIFVIELISEVMKNVSLSLRLFGNIHGGHEAVKAMNELGRPIYVPYGSFLLPIKILTCIVQALIFTLLSCVYISLVTHHDDDHGHDEVEGGHAALAH